MIPSTLPQWIYDVGTFWSQFNRVDLMAVGMAVFWCLWLWRKSADPTNTYDLSDTLKDSFTNKASAAPLVYMGMAALSTWYIVREEVDGNDPWNALLAVLGIFVLKAGADKAIGAWGTRQADKAPTPMPDPDAPVQQQAVPAPDIKVSVAAPAQIQTTTTIRGKKPPRGGPEGEV